MLEIVDDTPQLHKSATKKGTNIHRKELKVFRSGSLLNHETINGKFTLTKAYGRKDGTQPT